MRDWKIATQTYPCGAEMGCLIRPHEPYCILSGSGWKKLRCQQHAGSAPPKEIEPQRVVCEPSGFTKASSLAKTLPFTPRLVRDHRKLAAMDPD